MSTETLRAVATKQAERAKTIFDYLDNPKVVAGLNAVATQYLGAPRMLRLCVNAVKKTPTLLQCDPQTVLGAMMTSTALGLEPNTVQQQAFLIPYKRRAKVGNDWRDVYECQFQIGYRGFVTLAYRSPLVKRIEFEAIHAGDRFEHMQGSGAFLRFAKCLDDTRGPLIGAYSWALLESGLESACVLPLSEVHKIRGRSETYRALQRAIENAKDEKEKAKAEQKFADTPWVLWEDDMAAKSAIKKHAKQLPIAQQDALLAAAELDSQADAGRVDLRKMVDADVVREVFQDGQPLPQLEDNASPDATFVGDMEREESKQAAEQQAGADQTEQAQAKAAAQNERQQAAQDDKGAKK
jgi:recombination protein RecT